ncbi:MAG: N-acetyltransferase family protein [Ilumatobacter sp.]|uniref:GNAT family N-acetyltransferase n=1 Tax=Ilumatobacter sp. TaxID=1967498 RepID=UPI003C708B14
MKIRDAVDADIPTITDIFNQAIPSGDAEWTEVMHTVDGRTEWCRDRRASGRPVIVADVDGCVIGVASYGDFRDSSRREGFRFVCEHSVYLADSARGTGAADALMDELCERARANGLRRMIATVDAFNERSIAFHERRGFVEVGRMPDIGFTFDTWRTMVLLQLDL